MTAADKPIAIRAPSLFDGTSFHAEHCVIVRGTEIVELLPNSQCPGDVQVRELDHGTLAPGFIDLQVNGGGDALLATDPSEAALRNILAGHRSRGTTSLLPTLLSDTPQQQRRGVDAVTSLASTGCPGILGIHVEGPFFNPTRRGAHLQELIRPPSSGDITWLCSIELPVVMVTLAPEQVADADIEQLSAAGVMVCAGHTAATYEQLQAAVQLGVQGVTHLYNAMSPLTSREPGAVGAALDNNSLWAGIIADGHHVHPAAIRLAYDAKPRGKLILVSDAMATVGGTSDAFDWYDETIREEGGRLLNQSGVLAGSAIGLIDAVGFTHREVGLELSECLRMASLYPARILGLDDKLGQIAPGCRADLVHFDSDFHVHNTWLAGQQACHA